MLRMISHFILLAALLLGNGELNAQTYDTVTTVEEIKEDPETNYNDDDDDRKEERFIPRYERDSFLVNERELPPGYAGDLKKDNDFWYANAELEKEKKKTKDPKDKSPASYTPFMQQAWVQTLLWIIIAGGFAFAVLWYLIDSNVWLFRKKNLAAKIDSEVTDEMPEDIFAINYQKEVDRAVAQGNYRMAVRLLFLRMLKNLADKQIIRYKQDKTNLDYLMELSSKTYYPVFFRLTRHFEYSWYGHFEVGEEIYRAIAAEFNQFDKQV